MNNVFVYIRGGSWGNLSKYLKGVYYGYSSINSQDSRGSFRVWGVIMYLYRRGGSLDSVGGACIVAHNGYNRPSSKGYFIGFRVLGVFI